ncbi:MAG: hypothetical protein SFV54_08690, partial [Bryobacteraceae bacterium]|nr:hypothetical protein [Bryobacteraceae bacterium]
MSGTLRLLPPRALAVSLLLQVPGVLAAWPPELSWRRVLAGVTVLLCGCGLNVWAVWVFRRREAAVCTFSSWGRMLTGGPYR